MTLEKHNMLYAVQFALHEFDETGSVSSRTMEMLGARAILLRYEIESELTQALEREKAKKAVKVEPKEMAKALEPLVKKRKNGRPRTKCANCGTRLTGQQRKYCSKKCSKTHWNKNNPDLVKKYNSDWYQRQKDLGRA